MRRLKQFGVVPVFLMLSCVVLAALVAVLLAISWMFSVRGTGPVQVREMSGCGELKEFMANDSPEMLYCDISPYEGLVELTYEAESWRQVSGLLRSDLTAYLYRITWDPASREEIDRVEDVTALRGFRVTGHRMDARFEEPHRVATNAERGDVGYREDEWSKAVGEQDDARSAAFLQPGDQYEQYALEFHRGAYCYRVEGVYGIDASATQEEAQQRRQAAQAEVRQLAFGMMDQQTAV